MTTNRILDLKKIYQLDDNLDTEQDIDTYFEEQSPEIIYSIERNKWVLIKDDFNKLLKFLRTYQNRGIRIDEDIFEECKVIGIIDKNNKISTSGILFLSFENDRFEKCYTKIISQIAEKDPFFKRFILNFDFLTGRFLIQRDKKKLILHFKLLEVIGVVKKITCEQDNTIFQILNENAFKENIALWNQKKRKFIDDIAETVGFAASGFGPK